MNNSIGNYITLFCIGVVGTIGVKTGLFVWDKFVEPKVNKKY